MEDIAFATIAVGTLGVAVALGIWIGRAERRKFKMLLDLAKDRGDAT